MSTVVLGVVAVFLGLGVSGSCWLLLRAVNRCASRRSPQRFHDEGEGPTTTRGRRKPTRAAGFDAEAELTDMSEMGQGDRDVAPPPVAARDTKRRGKRGKRAERGPMLWHDDEGFGEEDNNEGDGKATLSLDVTSI